MSYSYVTKGRYAPVELECQRCYRPFVGFRASRKWCSRSCSNKAFAERKGQKQTFDLATVHGALIKAGIGPDQQSEVLNILGIPGWPTSGGEIA